jgi:ubiquinone/menaquinone biosynthesis C-methylase UbiE
MSSYESYDRTSAHYDRTRAAVGVEIVLGCLTQAGGALADMTVLDAGCGTGNYARAVLDHVARVEAVDLSAGMLAVARNKLAEAGRRGRIALYRAPIDTLPLASASVQGAMVNQVLHHLSDRPEAGWPAHRRAFAELARVLAPGGVLVINTCAHHQMRAGFWPYPLIPEAHDDAIARLMPIDEIEDALRAVGLSPRGRFVPVDAVLQGIDYHDPRGPLRADWRAGDSIWALVGDVQLAEVEARLRRLDDQGGLPDYVAAHDARRPEIGQFTVLYAIRD